MYAVPFVIFSSFSSFVVQSFQSHPPPRITA
jgi:hypothetical protein